MDWMEEICPNREPAEPQPTPSTGGRKNSGQPANRKASVNTSGRRSSKTTTPGRKATLQTTGRQSSKQGTPGRKATLTSVSSQSGKSTKAGRHETVTPSISIDRPKRRRSSRQKSAGPSSGESSPKEKSAKREKSAKSSGERKSKRKKSSKSEISDISLASEGTSRSGLLSVSFNSGPRQSLVFPGFESSRYTLSSSCASVLSSASSMNSFHIRERKVHASDLEINGFAVFEKRPGIIRNIAINPINQRLLVTGVDVFTGETYESVHDADDVVSVPAIHRMEAPVINVDDEYKMVTIPCGNGTREVKCSNDEILTGLKIEWRSKGIGDLWVEIMRAAGVERVIGFFHKPSPTSSRYRAIDY